MQQFRPPASGTGCHNELANLHSAKMTVLRMEPTRNQVMLGRCAPGIKVQLQIRRKIKIFDNSQLGQALDQS